MTTFEMIKYHGKAYPAEISLEIEEVAAHFDVTGISGKLDLSLHTEYSYGKRKLNTDLLKNYLLLYTAHKDKVPQLWRNKEWAYQFADFIVSLVGEKPAPRVIEIHPPFNDYTDIAEFIDVYSCFESRIKETFPDVEIMIENRCGSLYRGGKFIVSKIQDVELLCNYIEQKGIELKIAYDIPQIYTAHNARTEEEFLRLLEYTKAFRKHIGGVHLWGKKVSESGRRVAHCGDLNSYFENQEIKEHFLQAFCNCFDDGIVRKMVLEVNSVNEDLESIIADLKRVGIVFI